MYRLVLPCAMLSGRILCKKGHRTWRGAHLGTGTAVRPSTHPLLVSAAAVGTIAPGTLQDALQRGQCPLAAVSWLGVGVWT